MAEELKKTEENAAQEAQKLDDDALDAVAGGIRVVFKSPPWSQYLGPPEV